MTPNDRFTRCEAVILKWEGGLVDNISDPGGVTNHGVTMRALQTYLGRTVTPAEIINISPQLVSAVYRSEFWNAVRGDELAAGVDLMMFDGAVNQGPAGIIQQAQTALGLTEDGVIGPMTMAAITAKPSTSFISALSLERERNYRLDPKFNVFGRGWLNRLDNITALSLAWAKQI
jgi:lysozyme family protein